MSDARFCELQGAHSVRQRAAEGTKHCERRLSLRLHSSRPRKQRASQQCSKQRAAAQIEQSRKVSKWQVKREESNKFASFGERRKFVASRSAQRIARVGYRSVNGSVCFPPARVCLVVVALSLVGAELDEHEAEHRPDDARAERQQAEHPIRERDALAIGRRVAVATTGSGLR